MSTIQKPPFETVSATDAPVMFASVTLGPAVPPGRVEYCPSSDPESRTPGADSELPPPLPPQPQPCIAPHFRKAANATKPTSRIPPKRIALPLTPKAAPTGETV